MKIALYSQTFGKRVSRYFPIAILNEVLSFSNDNELFANVVNKLLNVSKYHPNFDEVLDYIIKD